MTDRQPEAPLGQAAGRPLRVHLVHQGFGDYVEALIDGMGCLIDAGHVDLTVTTLSSGTGAGDRFRPGPARYRRVVIPRFRDPRSLLMAKRAVSRIVAEPCDVLHWQAAGNPWADLWLSRSLRRRPTVVTVHDMQPHPGDRSVLPGTFAAIRRLVRRADRVIVHAPHVRRQAVSAGADPDRVEVLAHGELATRYLPVDRLPLPPSEDPAVLFFGRAQGYKGLDLLAEAMAKVAERVDGARLIVGGSGPSLDEVFPPGRPAPEWCEVHRGRIPDEEVPELFGRSTVVALPYREASQSGVAALAAGFGRPVVATAVDGLVDIVDHGATGLLVEPDDPAALAEAIVALLTDRRLAGELAAGAFRAARSELSWTGIANQLLHVYHAAVDDLSGHGGPCKNGGPRQ